MIVPGEKFSEDASGWEDSVTRQILMGFAGSAGLLRSARLEVDPGQGEKARMAAWMSPADLDQSI